MWPNCCGRCRSEISASMPIFSSSWRSNARTSRLAEAGWVWNSRSISAEETNSTVAKPWLNLRAAKDPLKQIARQRLAALVVPRELAQHLRLLLPVLVELRWQFDEIGEHAGAGQRGVGHLRP